MWNRSPSIFWGIVLVVLGVLFLLSNLDININWSVVWPVVLIALGVWLLVARVGPGGASDGRARSWLPREPRCFRTPCEGWDRLPWGRKS